MLDLAKYFETPANTHTEQTEEPVPPEPKEPELPRLKGKPARVFVNQALNALSDIAVDCRNANAVHVVVLVSGTTPSATISVEGSDEGGANYVPLPDPNASQSPVTAAVAFDVAVGCAWAKVRIASISGTFGTGQGFTVIVTPYVSGSQNKVKVEGVAGGVAVAVRESGGVTVAEYNVNLALADTEYSQVLPANTRKVIFRCRTAADVRYAWATGKVAGSVAPYQTLKASADYGIDGVLLAAATLYFASAVAGSVVEMEVWS